MRFERSRKNIFLLCSIERSGERENFNLTHAYGTGYRKKTLYQFMFADVIDLIRSVIFTFTGIKISLNNIPLKK
jgi:hypothetical protein